MKMEKEVKTHSIIDYLAFFVSAILSPYITATVFITVIVYRYSETFAQFLPWILTFFLFAILLPGIYVLWLFETRQIKNVHINNIKDRKTPFLLLAFSSAVGAVLLWLLGAARPVVVIGVVYAVNATVIAMITQYWKISVHTAMFSSIATITIILFGIQFWWLYLFLIPLTWARITRKRHTIWQAVSGSILAFFFTALVFWVFGYL